MALPAILDIRDDLQRLLEDTDDDEGVAEEIDTALDRLDAFAERDLADREGVLDDLDNQLLRVEELLDDEEAAGDVQAARNRIHIFRNSMQRTDRDLAVVDSGVSQHEQGDYDGVIPVGEVTIEATVANTGEDNEVAPVVTFYEVGGDEVESVRGSAFELEAGDQREIEMEVDVPGDASYYAVSLAEVDGVPDGQSV